MTTMRAILSKPAAFAKRTTTGFPEPLSSAPTTTHSSANLIAIQSTRQSTGQSDSPIDCDTATAPFESKDIKTQQAHLSIARHFNKNSPLMRQLRECLRSFQCTPPGKSLLLYALALLLPITIALFSTSFDSAEKNLLLNRNISIFLNPAIPDSEAQIMASSLAANEHIHSAAVAQMNIRGSNVMSINIQPAEKLLQDDLDKIVYEFNNHPAIEFVDADAAWLEENQYAVNTSRSLAWASTIAAALITIAVAFVITSKDLLHHRSQLSVLNQMGASHSTVLRPYFLRGAVLVMFALAVALLAVWITTTVAYQKFDISTYIGVFPTSLPLGQIVSLILLALSGCALTGVIFGKNILNS